MFDAAAGDALMTAPTEGPGVATDSAVCAAAGDAEAPVPDSIEDGEPSPWSETDGDGSSLTRRCST